MTRLGSEVCIAAVQAATRPLLAHNHRAATRIVIESQPTANVANAIIIFPSQGRRHVWELSS